MKEFPVASRQTSARPFSRPLQVATRSMIVAEELMHLIWVPAAVTILMWLTASAAVSALEVLCAWILACFPWGVYLSWRKQRQVGAPIFVFVAAMYWLYYAVALFYGDRKAPAYWSTGDVSAASVTQSMVLCVVGVACLWLGTRVRLKARASGPRFDIVMDERKWNYLRVILVAGVVMGTREGSVHVAGEGGRQFFVALQTTLPLVAFLILFRHYLRGQASRLDKYLLALFFGLKFVIGVAGGWLSTIVFVALGCFLIYLDEKRRPPYAALVPILIYIVFFQAGKSEFRAQSWYGSGEKQGVIERIGDWTSYSLKAWQEALDDTTGEKRTQLIRSVVMRTSLLTQTAHVLDNTPSQVPFQEGSTYSYLLATWIPRALWPDKPSVSEANQFYQVAYGLTRPEDLGNVSFAVGYMTEGYINFGWAGVCVVMFAIGVLFKWVQVTLLARNSGILWNAIGIMLLLSFISIEWQMAVYVGGLLQKVLIVLIAFFPLLRQKRLPERFARAASPTVAAR